MIVIFAIFLTSVFAQQEKYIDILPVNEKPEILDNVAKRITKSVESTGRNKQKIELDNTDLNAQNSYIQSIMEQETAALEARRRREDRSSEKNNKTKGNDDPKEGFEVKSFQFRKNDFDNLDSSADNIGLTVTGLNHPSYDKHPQDNFTENSKIVNVTEGTLPLQTQLVTGDVKSGETKVASTIKSSNEEKGKPSSNFQTQMQNSDLVNVNTETQKFNIKSTTSTLLTDFENNSQYETTRASNLPLSGTAISATQEMLHFEPSLNASKSYIQDSSNDTLTSFLPEKSNINSVKYTTAYEREDLSTILNSQVCSTTTKNKAEINTATTENYYAISKDPSEKESLENNTITTTFIPILTTSKIEKQQNTRKPKIIKLTNPIKQSKNDNLVSYVASKALKNIKHKLELKKNGKLLDNEIKTTNKGNTRLNHYQVYEIPWPNKRDNKLFLRSQEPIKDQPYYVPVYKYSPNFAYYNSKNRLGPNEVEENSIEIDTRLREGNKEIRDIVEPTEFILQLNNELRKFGYRKRKRKTTTKHPWNKTGKEEEEKLEKEKTEEEGNEEEGYKTIEEVPTAPTNTDFIKSDENISYLTHKPTLHHTTRAPTTDAYESSISCESADKESASCESSEEGLNDNKKKDKNSKGGLNDSKKKDENSKEGLNDSKKKDESSKEGLNDSKKKDENSKEGLDDSKKIDESSKEELIDNKNREDESFEEKKKDRKKKGHTIAEILSATVEKDLLTNLAKLQELDVPLLRSMVNSKVDIYMNLLKDFILEDSKSLKQYDWLMTTVRIQTALSKILKLIKRMNQSKQLYPADIQILRYMVFLQKFSLEIKKDKKLGNKLINRVKLISRNKRKRKNKLLKDNGLINRVWRYLKTPLSDLVKEDGLRNLYEFLIDVQDGLFGFHEAIRHIAEVTKFNHQNWYGNLKQVYLSADEMHLRELLLHISMSRLVDLLEHSCKHGLDREFIQFVNTNKKDAKRILEEIIFINDIVHEIAINKE